MTFSITPEKNSAGYSFVPLGASASITDQFEYLIDVVYNEVDVINITQVTLAGLIQAQLELSTNPFNSGDKIYFQDENNGGYYTVLFSQGVNVIISLIIVNTLGNDPKLYSYYGYKVPPDPIRGNAEIDLSPVLRNFITENIAATNSAYSAADTRFNYDVILGERKVFRFNFTDNIFVSGNIGFRNDTIPQNEIPPFEIGDRIFIQQEQTTADWRYFVFPNLNLQVGDPTGADPTDFFNTIGQVLLLNSQTAPQYNGFTTLEGILTQRLITGIPNPLAAVAGNDVQVTGFCRPEYNGVHTVTEVFFDVGLNEWIVKTDIPFQFNSPAVGGVITFASGERTTLNDLIRIDDRRVFNARWDKLEYNKNYNEYVIEGICSTHSADHKISTIYKSFSPDYNFSYSERRNFAPIGADTFSHLLVHNETENSTEGLWVQTFDKSDNTLSISFLENESGNDLDYYTPIGLIDMSNNPNKTDQVGTMSDILSSTAYYVVWAGPAELKIGECNTYTEKIPFLVDTCSKFQKFTIIFKDRRGSWAQYPFKMVSRKFIETERNNFYKQEGTFNDNDFFFDQFDRGEKSFATRSREKFRLTSDWVTEQQNYIIEDLFKSIAVFIQNSGGDLIPVILQNKEFESKRDINEMIYNYQFDITISNDDWRY